MTGGNISHYNQFLFQMSESTKLFNIARSVILDSAVEPPLFYLNILTNNPYPHRIKS